MALNKLTKLSELWFSYLYNGHTTWQACCKDQKRKYMSKCLAQVRAESKIGPWSELGAPACAIGASAGSVLFFLEGGASLFVCEINNNTRTP